MTIAEVSKKYGITADTLRYYEKEGLIPEVNRKNNIRNYTEEDCNWIEFIKCMRSSGMPIEALRKYVTLFMEGDNTMDERKQLLVEQREVLRIKLEEIKNTIDRLDYKIENYDKRIIEKNLR